jgi:hypothetical protein
MVTIHGQMAQPQPGKGRLKSQNCGKSSSQHKKRHENFETVPKLKLWLKRVLDTSSDGWMFPPLTREQRSKVAHRGAFEKWMQTARDAEGTGDDGIAKVKASRM